MADPKADDLVVNIAESPSAGSGKPGAPAPGAAQQAKDWLNAKPRNKWIAGGSLASLLLLPCIIAPAVVASQKQQAAAKRTKVPDWGAYRKVGSKSVYLDPLVRARQRPPARAARPLPPQGPRAPCQPAARGASSWGPARGGAGCTPALAPAPAPTTPTARARAP